VEHKPPRCPRSTAKQAPKKARCDQCRKDYEKTRPNRRFCSIKCKTKWHKAKPLGNGIPVKCKSTRNLKKHIELKIIVPYSEREKLAKILLPGADLYLARTTEDLFE